MSPPGFGRRTGKGGFRDISVHSRPRGWGLGSGPQFSVARGAGRRGSGQVGPHEENDAGGRQVCLCGAPDSGGWDTQDSSPAALSHDSAAGR